MLRGRCRTWAEPPSTATARSGFTQGPSIQLQGDMWVNPAPREMLPCVCVLTMQLLVCLPMCQCLWRGVEHPAPLCLSHVAPDFMDLRPASCPAYPLHLAQKPFPTFAHPYCLCLPKISQTALDLLLGSNVETRPKRSARAGSLLKEQWEAGCRISHVSCRS